MSRRVGGGVPPRASSKSIGTPALRPHRVRTARATPWSTPATTPTTGYPPSVGVVAQQNDRVPARRHLDRAGHHALGVQLLRPVRPPGAPAESTGRAGAATRPDCCPRRRRIGFSARGLERRRPQNCSAWGPGTTAPTSWACHPPFCITSASRWSPRGGSIRPAHTTSPPKAKRSRPRDRRVDQWHNSRAPAGRESLRRRAR